MFIVYSENFKTLHQVHYSWQLINFSAYALVVLSYLSYLSLNSDISSLRYFRMFWISSIHPALVPSLLLKCLLPYRVLHEKVDALCRFDVRRTWYFHWLNVMFDIYQHCCCSYGSAQDRKHCCGVGLILGYYSTAWPLSLNYSKIRQCCATDLTTFHCKYRTDRAKAR